MCVHISKQIKEQQLPSTNSDTFFHTVSTCVYVDVPKKNLFLSHIFLFCYICRQGGIRALSILFNISTTTTKPSR